MSEENLSDSTLIVLGHGTTLNPDSATPVFQHAAELRRRKHFAEVREAFWKQEPRLAGVLATISRARVFLVPLFMSEGYFSEEIIPRELGLDIEISAPNSRIRRSESQCLYYAKPVGTHDSMTDVILARARDVITRFPFPRAPKEQETTLFIAGHGTEQNENSRKPVERQVALIREQRRFAHVEGIFLEEDPRIGECYRLATTRNMIIVPFFVSDGLHTQEDIPVLLGESKRVVQERLHSGKPSWRNPTERNKKLLWYTASVGTDPHIANVILERAREASRWT